MIMTAGLGIRLKPFSDRLPKPLLPLMGIPVVQYAVDLLKKHGVKKVVANVHHLPELTRKGLERLDWQGMDFDVSDESGLLLGSAGGPRKALRKLGGDAFIYLNADVIVDLDLGALVEHHQRLRESKGVALTLAVGKSGAPGGRYREIFFKEDGIITGTGEIAEGRPFFLGAAVIEPEILKSISKDRPSDFLPSILFPAICESRAGVFRCDAFWLDIGSPGLWADAHFQLMRRLQEDSLSNGLKNRILQNNKMVGQGIWVEKSIALPSELKIQPPCYLAAAPASEGEVGPNFIFYGDSEAKPSAFQNAIVWDGLSQAI